mgnify:CR=1 FL=1|tara:strand:- start:6372 stop:6962 length:591 start_codon:yes stop_codon:yes gene_type:complete
MNKVFIVLLTSLLNVSFGEYIIKKEDIKESSQKAYFAAGCFWGVESLFQSLNGVLSTSVGYMNGNTENPNYKSVCYENTGHAEAVELIYNPKIISYRELCEYFWKIHDPTTQNQQGPDYGSQYRSAVFYITENERKTAEEVKKQFQKFWNNSIITEINKAEKYYLAEDYHQNYFKNKGLTHGGCHYVRKFDLENKD